MADRIQFKRGLKAELPILDVGEPAFCTDTSEFFIGSTTGNVLMEMEPAPPDVTGLTVLSVTSKSVTLSWDTLFGATSYEVEKNGVLIGSTTSTDYMASDLTESTSYTFTIKAVTAGGTSYGESISTTTVMVLIEDSFTRVNSSVLGVAESGQAWQIHNTSGTAIYSIDSGRAVMTNGGGHGSRNFAYIDAGVSNFKYQLQFQTILYGGAVFRARNQSDPVEFLRLRGNDTHYELARYRGATADASIGASTSVYGTTSFAPIDGDNIEVIADGMDIFVYVNGALAITAQISELMTETLIGINGGFNGENKNFFDNIMVSTLVVPPPPEEQPIDADMSVIKWVGAIENE